MGVGVLVGSVVGIGVVVVSLCLGRCINTYQYTYPRVCGGCRCGGNVIVWVYW